jgi:hypothetical protein
MTDTDDLSETDDELMDFYANLLEKSDGSQTDDSTGNAHGCESSRALPEDSKKWQHRRMDGWKILVM